ncbi:ATP-binding cassette domain-containing protein [uncultured Kriegella sp.]|uniref:ATP-binding cassette domain-containing protein n=1 Tax=uncultured Kriegella sp. TaxID=1798910 RepID=UPI0030DB398A|tara:strand:- start:180942 stop:182180 length:1239 start_codon:yes stop_codon:yes gene_type:complete
MSQTKHWAVFIDNTSDKGYLIDSLFSNTIPEGFEELKGATGALFSKLTLEKFIDEEDRHDTKIITSGTTQSLKTMSSGEQKKALLNYILGGTPHFIILDNPFDNLDIASQNKLKQRLEHISDTTSLLQLISRKKDLLPFINTFARLEKRTLTFYDDAASANTSRNSINFEGAIPLPSKRLRFDGEVLIDLRNINVSYSGNPILKNINWKIKKGEFWQLVGKNGSGKTTILSMITGENPKGYGQELYLFGIKKGSGESVWDIKKHIGYFTPSMTDKFTGYHSLEHMLISGLNDSVGLYVRPTEIQLKLAKQWLTLIDMWHIKDVHFHDLTMGQKRMVMCVRAMIKHPLLLILDEPTAGLDDQSAAMFVALVNKFAKESNTAIVFVSHRKEENLDPDHIYELSTTKEGSKGKVH